MYLLSIGKTIQHDGLNITSIEASSLSEHHDIEAYDYIIINGGDGTIRRVIKQLHDLDHIPVFILNPTGSFNVVAKLHRVPKIEKVLDTLANGKTPKTQMQKIYKLNDETFLFSAGNMGDLQHIFLSDFMLLSKSRFFIFIPLHFIKKFGSFYGEVKELTVDLENEYNMLELDGDIT